MENAQPDKVDGYISFLIENESILGPKLLLVMGCVKLGEKNCVHLPSVGGQTAN